MSAAGRQLSEDDARELARIFRRIHARHDARLERERERAEAEARREGEGGEHDAA